MPTHTPPQDDRVLIGWLREHTVLDAGPTWPETRLSLIQFLEAVEGDPGELTSVSNILYLVVSHDGLNCTFGSDMDSGAEITVPVELARRVLATVLEIGHW